MLSPAGSYAYSYPPAAYVAAPPIAPVMPVDAAHAAPPANAASAGAVAHAGAAAGAAAMPVSSIEQIAGWLRQAGEAGRRVAVAGSGRNVGTTYAAISLARALAQGGNVVLVDLALNAPNLSVISTDPQAPGIAELLRGQVSFGDIITRDQFSNVHLIATGNVAGEGAALAASPMLPSAIEALGAELRSRRASMSAPLPDVAAERFTPLSARAVLVAPTPAAPAARAARERLMAAGFADVSVLLGGAEAAGRLARPAGEPKGGASSQRTPGRRALI